MQTMNTGSHLDIGGGTKYFLPFASEGQLRQLHEREHQWTDEFTLAQTRGWSGAFLLHFCSPMQPFWFPFNAHQSFFHSAKSNTLKGIPMLQTKINKLGRCLGEAYLWAFWGSQYPCSAGAARHRYFAQCHQYIWYVREIRTEAETK